MNKIYIIVLLFLIPLLSFSQSDNNIGKKMGDELPHLLDGKKICLDPGHGGHDGDDRETPIDFGLTYWESDGVFSQAHYAAEILRDLGAEVKVTRYTNDTHDENRQPSLSERVAMANSYDADFFQSIHTNGNNGTSNYVLTIYRGINQVPVSPEGKRMCELMKDEISQVVAYNQTGSPIVRADKDMLPYHLGVLNGTMMPAMLSEAAFHDYKVEGRRLNNSMYQKAIAYSYVKSFLKFYDLGDMPVGEIGGVVKFKDSSEANEVKVTLIGSDFTKTQICDLGHNGYYFFDLLDEGTYSLTFEKIGQTSISIENIEVVKGKYTQNDVSFAGDESKIASDSPILIYVGNTPDNGVVAKWKKSNVDGLIGYKLYHSSDNVNWNIAADEIKLGVDATSIILEKSSDFSEVGSGDAKYFKLVYITPSGEGEPSVTYVKHKLDGSENVLIVDGYEGVSGDDDIDNAIALHYLQALEKNTSAASIETVMSKYIVTAGIDLKDYDVVVWASAFESAEDENIGANERRVLMGFLKYGGNLIISGSNIGYDLKLNGLRFTEQDFFTDYLMSKYDVADSGSKSVVGVSNNIFEGISFDFTENAEVNFPDALKTWNGSESVMDYSNGKIAAIGYRGGFDGSIELSRLLYFGFPLEASSQDNLDRVINKSFDYFNEEVALPAPPKPKLTELNFVKFNSNIDGVELNWNKSTSSYVAGYNIYYSEDNGSSWNLVVDYLKVGDSEISKKISFSEFQTQPTSYENLSFKINAVSSGNDQTVEGDDSKVFSIAKNDGDIEVLVVDGFDRIGTGFDNVSASLINIYTKAFAENKSIKTVTSCTNDMIKSGSINLNTYHAVYWILGEESTKEETFSNVEQVKVKEFLSNGGALFVSGSEIAWDLGSKGTTSDKDFLRNYLKSSYLSDGNSSLDAAKGVDETLFDGVSFDFSKLWKVGYPDVIKSIGSTVVFKYNDGSNAGVSYKGAFGEGTKNGGIVYLSFPIETADELDVKNVLDKSVEYFSELATDTAPIANNDDVKTVEGTEVSINVLANDVDNENNIDEESIVIIKEPKNGIAIVEESLIVYTPNTGFIGQDSFEYTVSDKTSKVSSSATVVVTINEKLGLPYETEIDFDHPKRDFRASFLTTAFSIDFPSSTNSSWQQNDLTKIIEGHYIGNVNAILFQARPACDAFYKSNIEPWAKPLTGVQGKDPGYDPLQYVIDEAHDRGMELHAWMNPYRTKLGSETVAANHIENTHPEWVMVYDDGKRILNPGIPEVIDYIVSVVEDVITNYDVDGIHFDDYFYAYGGTPNVMDNEEFLANNPDNLNRDDWRRDNINKMVKAVYDKIQEVNVAQGKNMVFGISPFGIWKNDVPSGIVGTSAYSSLYADALAWLEGGYVDYIAPQLYWRIGGAQDYRKLADWWNDQAASTTRFQYVSQAIYRMQSEHNWPVSEIQNQIDVNRDIRNKNTLGQIFYASKYFSAPTDKDGYKSIRTKLLETHYKFPSVTPTYVWKEKDAPNAPTSLVYSGGELSWTKPSIAADNDTARRYIIYRFNSMEELITDKHNGRRIVSVTGSTKMVVPSYWLNYGDNYFSISALDDNNNESDLSNAVIVESRPEYCEAKGVDSSSEWIESVKFHEAIYTSGNNNGYHDFSDKLFQLSVGGVTSFSLKPGFSGSSLLQQWKVFIDFNNDGDFSDSGETLFSTSSASSSAISKTIKLPLDVKEGVFKMRVIMEGTSSSNDIDPCTDVSKGEVEDYLVNLTRKELGLDDLEDGSKIGIAFPNPFKDQVNFSITSTRKENVELLVYNFMGQVVYHRTLVKHTGENQFSINSYNWSSGVYLLLVRDESGLKEIHEIIKQ